MNNLAVPQNGTAVANPGANFFQSYGEQASQKSIVGKLLKFSKGDYLVGENNDEVKAGTQLVANMDELMVGWIRWQDNKPTDQMMGRVAEGHQPQRRNELGDNDKTQWEVDEHGDERDPWQFSNYLVMKTPGESGDDDLFTFTTSSRGGLNAIGELCKTYGKEMRQRPDEYPIVSLEVGSYMHSNKAYGRIKFPILKVVGWAPKAEFAEVAEAAADETPAEPQAAPAKKGKGAAAETRF